MPSLFSKFRHRKSNSASSAGSNTSPSSPAFSSPQPRSPQQSTPSQRDSPNSPTGPTSQSTDDIGLNRARQEPYQSQAAPLPPPKIADQPRSHAPFADEIERPDLPTTSSNVNNAPPDASSLSWTARPLPSVPESDGNLMGQTATGGFTLPPGAEEPDQRRLQSPDVPTLPHIESTDRSFMTESARERPKAILSDSENIPRSEANRIGGQFQHVDSLSAPPLPPHFDETPVDEQGPNDGVSNDRFGYGIDNTVIPERGVNLHSERARAAASSGSAMNNQNSSRHEEVDRSTSYGPHNHLRSNRDPDIQSTDHVQRHLQLLNLEGQHRHDSTAYDHPISTAALEQQRSDLVSTIAEGSHMRGEQTAPLSAFGQQAFRAAGMEGMLGQPDTVDVNTKWLKPVVQENILRTEHTNYVTLVDQDIHKYHVYPKIQPISDTDPMRLATRHRIFSEADGKWHEVIGDEAAIAILGEEAFYNGRKQHREERKLALPALDGSSGGDGKIRERMYRLGEEKPPWHVVGGIGERSTNDKSVRASRIGMAL